MNGALRSAFWTTPEHWRERAVQVIVLRDSDYVDATAAYQIRLPLDLIRRYAPGTNRGDLIRLLLPPTRMPSKLNSACMRGAP